MALRLDYREVAPAAVAALGGLNRYADQCSIPPKLRRLVEILVSHLNGCTYCIGVHQAQARQLGEDPARIEALATWRQETVYTEAEQAAFSWAESVTDIARSPAPDQIYNKLVDHFSDLEIVDLTFLILSMNAWNRLAISFRR